MKRVTAFVGSARRKHTDEAVSRFFAHLEALGGVDCEVVMLSDYALETCRGCKLCFERGEEVCPLKDDRDVVISKIESSDAVILASPNHTMNVNWRMKNFIDRTYSLWHDRKLSGKYVVTVAVNGDTGADRALETLEGFANAHEFIYAGSVTGKAFLPGDIKEDAAALDAAKAIGKKIAGLG